MLLADPSVRRALWKSTGVLNEDDRKLNNGTPPSTKGGYKLPLIESLILTDQPKVKPTK